MSHYSKPIKRVSVPQVCSVKLFHAALVLLGWKFLTKTKPHFDTMAVFSSHPEENRLTPLTVFISSSQLFYSHIYMLHGIRNVRPVGRYVTRGWDLAVSARPGSAAAGSQWILSGHGSVSADWPPVLYCKIPAPGTQTENGNGHNSCGC